jgi:hypothetical protein
MNFFKSLLNLQFWILFYVTSGIPQVEYFVLRFAQFAHHQHLSFFEYFVECFMSEILNYFQQTLNLIKSFERDFSICNETLFFLNEAIIF